MSICDLCRCVLLSYDLLMSVVSQVSSDSGMPGSSSDDTGFSLSDLIDVDDFGEVGCLAQVHGDYGLQFDCSCGGCIQFRLLLVKYHKEVIELLRTADLLPAERVHRVRSAPVLPSGRRRRSASGGPARRCRAEAPPGTAQPAVAEP